MAEARALTPPALTLPAEEAALLREEYARARSILEYGSGGSTVLAGAVPGAAVFAVESDPAWLAQLARWFEAHPAEAEMHLHHADIGPVGKWGRPKEGAPPETFPGYALSVWDRADFVQPDVVLIDGRFRTACFLAVLFRAQRAVTVLFDDYVERKGYHVVERYAAPERIVGRMARFELVPRAVPPEDLAWIAAEFVRWH